jgi:hypothetical protein
LVVCYAELVVLGASLGIRVMATSGRARSMIAERPKSRDIRLCGVPASVIKVVHERNAVSHDAE